MADELEARQKYTIYRPPRRKLGSELMAWRYYDSCYIDNVGPEGKNISEYKFFFDVSGKDYFRTNMKAGGFLITKELFEIRAISAYIHPRINDWAALSGATPSISGGLTLLKKITSGYWLIKIGDKEYNVGTLAEIISTDQKILMSEATAGTHLIEAQASPFYKVSGVYPLEVPVTIEGGQTFYVEVKWNEVPALGVADTKIYFYVVLLGKKSRPVL